MLRCLPHLHHRCRKYHRKFTAIQHVCLYRWILSICCGKIVPKVQSAESLSFCRLLSPSRKESKPPSKKPSPTPNSFPIDAWFIRAILTVAIVVIDGRSCYLPIQTDPKAKPRVPTCKSAQKRRQSFHLNNRNRTLQERNRKHCKKHLLAVATQTLSVLALHLRGDT